MVDKEFWTLVNFKRADSGYHDSLAKHARKVFKLITAAAYGDGTGEPGLINIDKLNVNSNGIDKLKKGNIIGSSKYQIEEDTNLYINRLVSKSLKKTYWMIVNPCSEISIALWGAYCCIGDLVPFHAKDLNEAEEAFRALTRALIRVNTMDALYNVELKRTNRIGVGMTGIHEFAWKFFKLGFKDLIDEEKSKEFWLTLSRFKNAVQDEAEKYAKKYGMEVPHTDTTLKPAGTNSKLFGLTEGWHLPPMLWYLRWVQFSKNDPLIEKYKRNGYPIRELKKYQNTVIVGFPTTPVICELGMGDKLVTAAEATPEEQYKWISLGEKYWIRGINLEKDTGNQISYTLKYNPKKISYTDFVHTLKKWQGKIKCCSIMPQEEQVSYEYLPEQPVTKAEYESILNKIKNTLEEDVDFVHVDCSSGACPINFKKAI